MRVDNFGKLPKMKSGIFQEVCENKGVEPLGRKYELEKALEAIEVRPRMLR